MCEHVLGVWRLFTVEALFFTYSSDHVHMPSNYSGQTELQKLEH